MTDSTRDALLLQLSNLQTTYEQTGEEWAAIAIQLIERRLVEIHPLHAQVLNRRTYQPTRSEQYARDCANAAVMNASAQLAEIDAQLQAAGTLHSRQRG